MCVLRPVASPKGLNKPDDFSALLESGVHQRQISEMREQRAARNEQVAPRNKDLERPCSERCKEGLQVCTIRFRENREAWNGAALASIVGRRNPPNATPPAPKLSFFFWRVFFQTHCCPAKNLLQLVMPAESVC